ncbi:MAG: M4 family metallopeptidase, partial [Actinomycetota bacterium]
MLSRRSVRLPAIAVGVIIATAMCSAGWVGAARTTSSTRATTVAPLGAGAALLAPLRTATGGTLTIATDGIGGAVPFVGAAAGRPLSAARSGDLGIAARSLVNQVGPAFGVSDPQNELVEDRRTRTLAGTAVRFRQQYLGVPVLGGELAVAVRADGAVSSVSGEAVPALEVDTAPTVAAGVAADVAVREVAGKHGDTAGLTAASPTLWIYDPQVMGAPGMPIARLVWRTTVSNASGDIGETVLVDAHRGVVALRFDNVETVKNRQVCDNALEVLPYVCTSPVLAEGGDVTEKNSDVLDAYNNAGATYDFYSATLGRDSVDGAGLSLKSTVRFCPTTRGCSYQNAFWTGSQMVYGAGFAHGLDVVAHELTHGVTDYTSGLFYFAQSGAINESMSDVFGEIVQLANLPGGAAEQTAWLLGEDLFAGGIRSMSSPPDKGDPDRMTSALYSGSSSDNYGVHTNSGVNNKAAYLMAKGGTFNGRDMGSGIGIVKTARVYYQAQTALLAPASDYLDLSNVLPQACTQLVGTNGITVGDCTVVSNAVLATEMNLAPTMAGANALLDRCPAGQVVTTTVLLDNFDTSSVNWATSASTGSAQWSRQQAQSASSVFYGPDLGFVASGEAYMVAGAVIPASGTTYLQVRHAFEFESDSNGYYDGGVIQYSTSGPAGTYADVGALSGAGIVNGYNHRLFAGGKNVLRDRNAFAGASPGFETTQVNLSTLAGQT